MGSVRLPGIRWLILVCACLLWPAARTGSEPEEDALRLTARVVDDRRRPLAGAEIQVCVPAREPWTVRSDAEGRFEIRLPGVPVARPGERPRLGFHMTHRDPATGRLRAGAGVRALDAQLRVRRRLGTFVLEPAAPQVVRVVAKGEPVGGCRVHLRDRVREAVVCMAETDDHGRARFAALADGVYDALAVQAGVRRGHGLLRRGQGIRAEPVTISLRTDTPLLIHVVEDGSGRPLSGVIIHVQDRFERFPDPRLPWQPLAPTDPNGHTQLAGGTSGVPTTLLVYAPGFVRHVAAVAPEQTEVEVRVRMGTHTGHWPLADPSAGPPEGTRLRILPPWPRATAPSVGRIENGQVVVDGWLEESPLGNAVAPDGSVADLSYDIRRPAGGGVADGRTENRKARFLPPRTLRLEIRESDGAPAAGRWIQIVGPDFFVEESGALAPAGASTARTDASGQVSFRAVFGDGTTLVRLLSDERADHDVLLGTIAGTAVESRRHLLTVPPGRDVVLTLWEGEVARLPSHLQVVFDGAVLRRWTEDPGTGTLRFRIHHPRLEGEAGLQVRDPADAQVHFETLAIPLAGHEALALHAHRERRHAFRLRVTPAGDFGFIPDSVQVHRWDPELRRWRHVWQRTHGQPPPPPSQPGNERVLGDLRAGRYRVVDVVGNLAGAAFEVGGENTPKLVVFDRSAIRRIEGEIRLPRGLSAGEVTLSCPELPPNLDWRWRGHPAPRPIQPQRDGSLDLHVPTGRAFRLVVQHPLCHPETLEIPARDAPRFTVHLRARASLRVALDARPDFRFLRPVPSPWMGAPRRYQTPAEMARVYLRTAGEETWTPVPISWPARDDLGFLVAGDPLLPQQVRVDLPGWRPFVLTGVLFGQTRPAVRQAHLRKGSRVHVRFDLPPDAELSWVQARALSQTEPSYERKARGRTFRDGERRLDGTYELIDCGVWIEGLGAGTFEIEAAVFFRHEGRDRTVRRTQRIEVDGRTRDSIRFRVR